MNRYITKHICLLSFIIVLLWSSPPMYSMAYQDTMSLDPGIRYGKLTNGLTYYIKSVDTTSKAIDMRLIVKAGSNQEDPDQYDLAHFMEHIALKAGKHISTKMQYGSKMFNRLGIKTNAINAMTSKEFTEYRFIVPAHNEKARTVAFRLFQDIIWDLEFKPVYIESERSPFLEESEFRGGKSSLTNMKYILDSRFTGCGGKFPEDYLNYINNFEHQHLIRFYNDWYRPDLMALTIVGNIEDIDGLEREIKDKFSLPKNIGKPRDRTDCNEHYLNGDFRFVTLERDTLSQESTYEPVYLRLYMRESELLERGSVEELENDLKRNLFIKMLNNRYVQKQWAYNKHYDIYSEFSDFPSALIINIRAYRNQEKQAISEIFTTLKQVEKYGFSVKEFNMAKTDIHQSIEKLDTTTVSYWREEFRNHFVYGKSLLQNKNTRLKAILGNINLEEINNFSRDRIKNMPEDIGIIASSGTIALSYKEKIIRKWIAEADTFKTMPYHVPVILPSLMDTIEIKRLKYSAFKEETSDIPGAKEYVLSNGLKLIFNSFKPAQDIFGGNESVVFQGFVPKGASCFLKEDYFSAINAPEIIKNSGIGGKDKFEMKRYLSNQDFKNYVAPYIGYEESGINGNTTTKLKDLEIALQLVYLYFTAPNYNELAYQDWKMSAPKRYLNDIVQDDFNTAVKDIFNDSLDLPRGTKRMEGVESTDLQRAHMIYRKLFNNPQEYVFIFSGDFEEDKLLLLCRKYLGNLPNSTSQIECKNELINQDKIPDRTFAMDLSTRKNIDNVRVRLVYIKPLGKANLNWMEKTKLDLLSRFLEYSFLKHLRKDSEKGGPYVALVSNDNNDGVSKYNKLSIDFGCRPEDADRLIMESKQIIDNLKKSPETEKNLFIAVKNRLMPVSNVETNNEALNKLYIHHRYGYPWISKSAVRDYIGSLSMEDLQESAQEWLASEPFEFRMVPQ